MVSILLHLDQKFFNKMKMDKFVRERRNNKRMTWEAYIKLIFGFAQ